ncbi:MULTISPECIES: DUF2243 domain-containing protein [unclassified Bacillus (in: firmicutes)]|uniref:DUF2243 domain-containing protein n=1 Tax=unclassified Bacillus (in: firmicutes) TaxID=185979 RepID=UPI0008F29D8D|nr:MULTISPECIES: DUF2243 domain-containing protein [unclassified Bacillus (in: firmicutes)]SFA70088.1 Predicted membrane protein [Bacillus sp. UNCCL13]SFQ59593.1 Predicted membrane protein [Bacillus sp. cl95]
MFSFRTLGFTTGYFMTGFLFHGLKVSAMGVQLDSMSERLGAIGFGLIMLALFMILFKKLFSESFFNGFLVATGLFLSFDIVVFHWIFGLHRITSGPEANWLEPLFVVSGSLVIFLGVIKERKATLLTTGV